MRAQESKRLLGGLALLGLGLVAAAFFVSKRLQLEVADLARELRSESPTAWATAPPSELGFSPAALAALRAELPAQHTRALLVARRGRIVLEWYQAGEIASDRFPTAALAKGVVATPLALAAASDGWIGLDDPVSRHLPSWTEEGPRSEVRLSHLLSHSAGLENVSFPRAKAITQGERSADGFPAWKREYYLEPGDRFHLAAELAPLLRPPGTRYEYSGVGFYVLALALAKAAREQGVADLEAWYAERLLEPLGIPRHAWEISYRTQYERDGLRLYALGSGARFSARALARIGQLFLQHGRWEGRALLEPELVERALSNAGLPPPTDATGAPQPSPGLGWWVNRPRFFRSLPPDAAVAAGAKQQVVLVVPSLELVVVRTGGALGESSWQGSFWRDLEKALFEPLMESLDSSAGPEAGGGPG